MKRGLIVLMLAAALLGGGLAHATVTHEHGEHSASGETSAVWTQLHSSLRHEDKKALFMLVESSVLIVLAALATSSVLTRSGELSNTQASLRDPYAREALRKGIYRYRVFG